MQAAGLAAIEAAKADGRWEAAYPAQSQAQVSEDFQRRSTPTRQAAAFFATLTGSTRYAFLYRLHNVADPGAREKRIAMYVELLSEGKRLPTD